MTADHKEYILAAIHWWNNHLLASTPASVFLPWLERVVEDPIANVPPAWMWEYKQSQQKHQQNQFLSEPLGECQKPGQTGFQDCSNCERVSCGDNTNAKLKGN